MRKELSFDTPFAPISFKFIISLPILLFAITLYFDPFQLLANVESRYPFIPYITLILAAISFLFVITTCFDSAISKIVIENDKLILYKESLFSNDSSPLNIEAKHLYYLKHSPNINKKTLITRHGSFRIYSADGLQTLSTALKEAYFNNREFYEALAEEDIYDIYHSLPSGSQAELVRSIINKASDEDKNERIKELLEPGGAEELQRFNEPLFSPAKIEEPGFIHGLKECPNCKSNNTSSGIIQAQHFMHVEPSDYTLPMRKIFVGESYPRLSNKIDFCRDCGFAWSYIQITKFKQQLEEFSPVDTKV